VSALADYARVLDAIEVAPWNGPPHNERNPGGAVRRWSFGPDAAGQVLYLVLDEQREVHAAGAVARAGLTRTCQPGAVGSCAGAPRRQPVVIVSSDGLNDAARPWLLGVPVRADDPQDILAVPIEGPGWADVASLTRFHRRRLAKRVDALDPSAVERIDTRCVPRSISRPTRCRPSALQSRPMSELASESMSQRLREAPAERSEAER
jgi:mRNA interferase MazF